MEKHNWAKLTLLSFGLASLVGCGGGGSNNSDNPNAGGNGGGLDKRILFLNDGVHGTEPWITDGTTEGTKLLKDINATGSSITNGYAQSYGKLGDKWFFIANNGSVQDGKNGHQLWSTDGTSKGTKMVTSFPEGIDFNYPRFSAYKDKLYFAMKTINDVNGTELWSTDGTAEGTVRVADICAGACSSNPVNLREFNGKLYFTAYTEVEGNELWSTDGTETGTKLFKDIAFNDPDLPSLRSSYPTSFTVFDDKLFFTANSRFGRQLWKSDGTTDGTVLVKDFFPDMTRVVNAQSILLAGSTMYFTGVTETSSNRYLYRSDGTEAGSNIVKDANDGIIKMVSFTRPTVVGGTVYFSNGNILKVDAANTTYLTNNLERPSKSVVVDDTLYVIAKTTTYGYEVYYLPLSPAQTPTAATVIDINTRLITETGTATFGSNPNDIFVLNDKVYVMADNGTTGSELWVVDPETKQVELLKDVNSTVDGAGAFSFGDTL